jgi:hypothetical protein
MERAEDSRAGREWSLVGLEEHLAVVAFAQANRE